MKKLLSTICAFALTFGCVLGATSCGSKNDDNGNNNSSDVLKLVNINLTEESYAYAINKGNDELKTSFDAYLTEIKGNGVFDTIKKKYLEGEGEKVGLNVNETVSEGGASKGVTDNKLVVLTNTNFEPFEFVGDDGKYYGIDMEIAKGFAESLNKEIYLIEWIDFDSIVTQANQYSNAIVAAGLTYDEDRAEIVDFTQTYFTTSQVIVAKADDTTFDNCTTADEVKAIIEKMNNKTFGFQNGTQGAWFVDEYKNLTASGYKTAALAGQALANGSIDYLVVDAEPAKAIVKAINEVNK